MLNASFFFFFHIIDLMINKVTKMIGNAEVLQLGKTCGNLTKLYERKLNSLSINTK